MTKLPFCGFFFDHSAQISRRTGKKTPVGGTKDSKYCLFIYIGGSSKANDFVKNEVFLAQSQRKKSDLDFFSSNVIWQLHKLDNKTFYIASIYQYIQFVQTNSLYLYLIITLFFIKGCIKNR